MSGCQDASPGFCGGWGVEAIIYAGEACINAEGGGGIEIFMFDFVEERLELRVRDSSDAEDIVM